MLAEPALAQCKLADEAFAGGNVGIGFNPHGAFRQERALLGLCHHARIHVGIQRFQVFQNGRFAHQERIIPVFVHQRQLIGIGARGFTHGFLYRPQPCHVQMGLAKHRVLRRSGAVCAVQKRSEHLGSLGDAGGQFLFRQFKIRNVCKLFESFDDLHRAKALWRQLFDKAVERAVIHGGLKDGFVPNGKVRLTHRHLRGRRFRHGLFTPCYRACALVAHAMTGIAFGVNFVDRACLGAACKGDIRMLFVNRACFHAVDPHQHLLADAEVHYQPLAFQRLRHGYPGAEPAVFPLCAPFHAHGRRLKIPLNSLFKGQMRHRGKIINGKRTMLLRKVLFKLLRPDSQPVLPLSADIHTQNTCLYGKVRPLRLTFFHQFMHSIRNRIASA